MFTRVESADVAAAVDQLHAGRAALNALPLHTLTDADLLTVLREQEADARRAAVSQHAVIAELEARGPPASVGSPRPRPCWWRCCGSTRARPRGGSATRRTSDRGVR